jgi:two-component system sensor histidine kinase KdpD
MSQNPDEILKAVVEEEKKQQRGRHKIFLGMAAGVGKTFAMLEEAQRLGKQGIDIVVGSVNSHGRHETESLLMGLRIVPEKIVNYRDTQIRELDLDEILRLKPELVIVDELAHSNVPGSRHPKRWQDVNEILDNGIDVFSTLNIQHVESVKDEIEIIAGITIHETVPDSVVEGATFIELIDLTPYELLQRLKDGKVYLGDQSIIAAQNFFQADRLTALREMALRYAAEKVDHELHGMVSTIQRASGWRPRERILVSVNASPESQKLIRFARRIAFNSNAPWIALQVNNGTALDSVETTTLAKNLSLARDLGAEIITTSDPNIPEAIARVAKERGVTQIIVGRTPRTFLARFFSRHSILDQLVALCGDIDIHVIRHRLPPSKRIKKSWSPYLYTTGLFAFLTALYAFLKTIFGFSEYQALGILIFLAAISIGILINRIRKNREMFLKREGTTEALYEIAREIATAPSRSDLLQSVSQKLSNSLEGKCEILLKRLDGGLAFDDRKNFRDDKEKAAAFWVFQNGKEAGWSTTTLPSEKKLFIPLKNPEEIFGVLTYEPQLKHELSIEDKNFLYTVAQLLTNHLERRFAEETRRKEETFDLTERIYQTIFDLISKRFHDPLQLIHDAIGELKSENVIKDNGLGTRSVYRIQDFSEGLIRDIENISSMAKLSAGEILVRKGLYHIQELIELSTENVKKIMGARQLAIHIPEDLPPLYFDLSLLEILVSNLLLNAIQNSPEYSTITIGVKKVDGTLALSISDEGKGIPPNMLEVIFNKFTRLPGSSNEGLGLGLSIAKTIAEVHHGKLKAENLPGRGTKFTLFLPIRS